MYIINVIVLVFLSALFGFSGAMYGCVVMGNNVADIQKKFSDKQEINDLLYMWIHNKINKIELEKYFYRNNYSSIAIYGYGDLGTIFVDELKANKLDSIIKYVIDKNSDNIDIDIKIVKPDGELDAVDVIVVTPIQYYSEIKDALEKRIRCPIVSLEDVLYELSNEK